MNRSKKQFRFRLKSLLSLTFALLLVFLMLSGCSGLNPSGGSSNGQVASSTQQPAKLKIVASVFAPYDFARQIVGDVASVQMLVPPGAETHSFEPSPRDILTLQDADVFIYVGGESDAWIEDILESLDTSKLKTIRLIDLVTTLDEVQLEGMQKEATEKSNDTDQPEPDEHVWTSVTNAAAIVLGISQNLEQWEPADAATYRENTNDYLEKLAALDQSFKEVIDNSQRKTLVFGDRFPFRYLAEEYGLECYAAFSGCSTAVDTNPQTIKFLVDKVQELDLPVVFYIELSSHKIADAISESTGAQELELHSCHNISKQDFDDGLTYLDLMNQNVANLKVALN